MKVKVKLFATLRQQAGWSEKTVELEPDATVSDLLEAMEDSESGLRLLDRTVYVAINQEYVKGNSTLHEDDEVALFPPVSGGVGA